jgi:hypothetical protein
MRRHRRESCKPDVGIGREVCTLAPYAGHQSLLLTREHGICNSKSLSCSSCATAGPTASHVLSTCPAGTHCVLLPAMAAPIRGLEVLCTNTSLVMITLVKGGHGCCSYRARPGVAVDSFLSRALGHTVRAIVQLAQSYGLGVWLTSLRHMQLLS